MITVKWIYNANKIEIESRFVDDLTLDTTLEWDLLGYSVKNVKILYNKKFWKNRFTVVVDTGYSTLTANFRLIKDGSKITIVKDVIEAEKISFSSSVAYKQYIVTMVGNSKCILQFYNEYFIEISGNKLTYGDEISCSYHPLYNFEDNFQLFAQDNY